MITRFIGNKAAIFAAAVEPGPYIYSVQIDRLSRLYPAQESDDFPRTVQIAAVEASRLPG